MEENARPEERAVPLLPLTELGTAVASNEATPAQNKGGWTRLLCVAMCVGPVGGFALGWDTALTGIKIISISYQMALSPTEQSAVLVVVPVSTMLAGLYAGVFSTKKGRVATITAAAWMLMLGAAISAEAWAFWPIFIGRGLIGSAFGFTLTAIPVYIAECAPTEHRGKMVVMTELFLSIASCAAYAGSLALQQVLIDDDNNPETPKGWRIMAGSVGVPGLLLLLVIMHVPESPRWYISQGMFDKARETQKQLRGDTQAAEDELEDMISAYNDSPAAPPASYTQLLTADDMAIKRACLIGSVLSALYAFVHLQFHYAPTVLIHAGFDVKQMLSLQTGNQMLRIVASTVAMGIIDSWGRRQVLFGVFGFAGSGFLVLAIGFQQQNSTLAALGVTLVYIGRAIQPRGVETELFPLAVRSVGKGWTSSVLKACQALSVGTTLLWVEALGWDGVFFIQAALGIFGLVFVLKNLPETKNKSLEKIEKQLRLGTIETPPVTPNHSDLHGEEDVMEGIMEVTDEQASVDASSVVFATPR